MSDVALERRGGAEAAPAPIASARDLLPFVLFGTFRYLYRLRHRGGGGDPSSELVRDPWLLASVAGWVATVVLLIG